MRRLFKISTRKVFRWVAVNCGHKFTQIGVLMVPNNGHYTIAGLSG